MPAMMTAVSRFAVRCFSLLCILTLDFEDERANINGDYGLANWC